MLTAACGKLTPTKLKLPRYRWWFIPCLAAVAIAAIGWWQLSGPRLTREQYDRSRLGMTPAEVAAVMGCPPNADKYSFADRTGWEVDYNPVVDATVPPVDLVFASIQAWSNGSVDIFVFYRDGKVIWKAREFYQSWWKKWLKWLRGLVGW